MKPRVYLIVLLLLLPLQAGLLAPLARFGLRPDLGLAVIYTVGLITRPAEAALAGIAIGLLQDLGSASLLGFSGLTHGIAGLFAGLLGQRVLDMQSFSNILLLFFFSLAESLLTSVFLDVTYGAFPIVSQFFRHMLPEAAVTAAAGFIILRLTTRREALAWVRRRALQKER